MHLRRFFAVFMLFLLFSPVLPYASDSELSLDEAVSLAMENNLGLKKNQIDLAASGYSEKFLLAEIFPTINATASAGVSSALFTGGGLEFNDSTIRNSVGLGINFGLNAGIPYSIKNIKLAHQANLLKDEDARKQLSILVTKKFYSLIAEKNNLILLGEILNLAQRQYDRNQISFRNGLIRELVLIQSSVALENARYDLSAASISYSNNLAEFIDMLGIASDEDINLLGVINIVKIDADTEELIKDYLPKRPDIVRGRQEIERLLNAEKQLALQTRAPSINLSVDWSASKFNPFTDNFSGTARLTIPIDPFLPGTARSQAISRAGDSALKAKLDLTMTEDAAKTQIRSLASLLRNSWSSIEIARLSLDVANRSYQMTDQGFRNGTVESLVLEDARNNMANAQQRLLQTELSYFNMILDLSAAINMDWKDLIQTYGASR
uniref:TonB-dependent receptor n=1 Tax=uncultured bacterium contig00007 TaxID=1181499 RepID=A0A806KHG2_9BACT|nr:TonB-dependent receptor [uncultured bacterium contig00007]